ncbi:glycoside hydrolase family 15 protein [Acidomonas methanolica]|uniref:Glycoside hydrolase n=1 Tax=Acidomonas methanolica NBRC 104435 TaxID=1231351 RepID=A0A023D3R7_ACIMT|nr:glycoside hydrolase family 15 protein [Acidomonas methanolica]MBU2655006.1 glycoside hydrolase family 15 protein [Acidomonas methanolica]TCS25679.1 GH15 family glucan-1,4-alpha-glucosidase [Acidomonas methanolica]GAJ28466.1 glycoside hydrolase [Acidomonas methanolica NBRC 104435]GBQ45198.1 glycoside hydrolase 15-related protein [Acidomonas methanolica]GEK99490.1 glucoamylase [Acidomonas methanolica NBRC 104435]
MADMAIENHAVIGGLRTTALVALNGSIDFLCWPRFDSPSVFASLLDPEAGEFSLAPALEGGRLTQFYVPDTNVLLTRRLSTEGVSEISDFMVPLPVDPVQRLIRRVKAVRGRVTYRLRCAPRFDYARVSHSIEQPEACQVIFRPDGPDLPPLRLCASVPLTIEGDAVVAEFALEQNDTATFTLDSEEAGENICLEPHRVAEAFKETSTYWRDWVAHSSYTGRWREHMTRSALALKLLTSAEYGSMVAAATFGLPEDPGGVRNWDYRYCWVRDSSFMVNAFMKMGYREEATAFIRWLHERRLAAKPGEARLRVLYGIDGRNIDFETDLDHFQGYRDSRPVRIGNGAEGQLQLDIIGEVMDAISLADEAFERLSHEEWISVAEAMDWLSVNWNQPDESIWEVRGGKRHFLFSRFMCWVALDRGIGIARRRSLPGRVALWRRERDAIYHDIHENFWNEDLGYFTQFKGGDAIDASCLLMPLMGFIGDHDPRWQSTLNAVGERLVDDSHVYRYEVKKGENHDGLTGTEGTFTMCSFWYVECLARSGDLLQARFLFEKMLSYANHAGLFSEEIGPAGEHLGNFPQAFTHLALIRAGLYLDQALSRAGRCN